MIRAESTTDENRDPLMPPPPASEGGAVKAWHQPVVLPTYLPKTPDRNPMFFEKRVYQGSSGKVYPLPFIDAIATEPVPHEWKAIHIENETLRVMLLPEIGGRIHIAYDKVNGYDFIYRQDVIKPSLVGLAGPWISGGIEFNWPQHHRPATFMEVNTEIERSADGSVTVWCSDHDPMSRMKGMHGICLHPGKSVIEIKVRLFNRTSLTQTFLWWANIAARVHEHYQSFFPPDVRHVADHAKRAVTTFPWSNKPYYGVDYPERDISGVPEHEQPRMFRPDGSYRANDLSWYANIPVPTSYMVTGTKYDFLGGYDHMIGAGFVHWANHHIAPGKKQWTWGNHEFGYAWDRNLTDHGGPYIELMAGVYTDNQPDFSYLAPGETRTFSQLIYPIREIGLPVSANEHAALSVVAQHGMCKLGVCVTRTLIDATLTLTSHGKPVRQWRQTIQPQTPLHVEEAIEADGIRVTLCAEGSEILSYDPSAIIPAPEPAVAVEPPSPKDVSTAEELFLIGQHLAQYRHATRYPEAYWAEAVRRDPGDSRANNALGLFHLRRGEFAAAEGHFRTAIARLTALNPNPYDGEAYYNLGQTLRFLDRLDDAYTALYKATWNAAWQGCAFAALAELDMRREDWEAALAHLQKSLASDAENANTTCLRAIVLKRLGRSEEADALLTGLLKLDPLNLWARHILRGEVPHHGQERLDLAFDYMRCGLWEQARAVLLTEQMPVLDGSGPMLLYALASVELHLGNDTAAAEALTLAASMPTDYVFPSRLEEQLVLEKALARNPRDARAALYLGNYLYHLRRHDEAIVLWERAAEIDPSHPTVWRNLGIARYNVLHQPQGAQDAYDSARLADPSDARIFYERDQLWKRLGVDPHQRLHELEGSMQLVHQRDSLAVEFATLLNQAGRPLEALNLLLSRQFQPWEGGEGLVLQQYVRANLLLGRSALRDGEPETALSFFTRALVVPENLGEAKHLLANESQTYYWLGEACDALGDRTGAVHWWKLAASQRGDFQQMAVQAISEMTYWTAMALHKLGDSETAYGLFQKIYDESFALEQGEPKIDYFATSLPAMLLFDEDLKQRRRVTARFLRGLALLGMGDRQQALTLLRQVQEMDISHVAAADLLDSVMETEDVGEGNAATIQPVDTQRRSHAGRTA